MKQLKVSVIVPAYNTEDYIGNMIECLLMQTYTNLQLIFIDDGSTDNTAKIIKSYQDTRIEYYYQENSGVSVARNLGIQKANGEKIFFFDSDDTFEAELIEKCLSFAEQNKVESVLYGYGNKVNGKVTNKHIFKLNGVYRKDQIVDKVMPAFLGHSFEDVNMWLRGKCGQREGKEHTALWRIMLDSHIVKDNRLCFDPTLSLGEDTKFINTYLLFTQSIGILNETLYYLTIRAGSANVTSNQNPVLMAQNKEKLICAREEIDLIALKHGKETHPYWQGTLVLSAVQLAIRLSHNEQSSSQKSDHILNTGGGYETFCHYMYNKSVQLAIKNFHPYLGSVKAIPFVLLKLHLSWMLYGILRVIPQKIIDKLL